MRRRTLMCALALAACDARLVTEYLERGDASREGGAVADAATVDGAVGEAGEPPPADAAVSRDGDPPPGRDAGPPPPPRDAGPPPLGDAEPPPPPRDAEPPPVDAGLCPGNLADALSVHPIADTHWSSRATATPLTGGGAVVAWVAGREVHLTRVDAALQRRGADVVVPGSEIYGLAASDEVWSVLVARGDDVLALVGVTPQGEVRFDQVEIGDVDHGGVNNDWFGPMIREGRLMWTGQQWVAYFTVQRLWDDGVAHYGDTLRLYGPGGERVGGGWDWGCSHGMEMRLAHGGGRVAPVCASDCFPSKGVHFNFRTARLYPDETGANCSGGYGTTLGGNVPRPDGFWVAFTAGDARAQKDAALVFVDARGRPGEPVWLTEGPGNTTGLHVAAFGDGMIAGWRRGGASALVRLDARAAMIGEPLPVGVDFDHSSDFFVYDNGDVGWATPADRAVGLARLRACP